MRKITALLLLAAMLTQFAACSSSSPTETKTDFQETTETVIPTETRTPHNVPTGTTFDGETFTAGVFGSSIWPDLYFSDELTGDNMNDAVFRREKKVESMLDVKIDYNEDVEYDEFISLFKANDDLYQVLFLHRISHVADLVTGNYLYDSNNLPYVDFSSPWYNGEQIDSLRMSDAIHYIVSDFVITDPSAVFFNRSLIEDNNLDDPYALVSNGTWTLDKMVQMCIDIRHDINGDGEYTSQDDVYGMIMTEGFSFLIGCDQKMTAINPDTGRHELIINDEKTFSILDKLYRLYEHPGSVNIKLPESVPYVQYKHGTTLFNISVTTDMESIAQITEFDSGVIPMPKYDEAQEKYHSLNCNGLMTISGCINNPEMVGAVIELLSWESGNEVVDTYYNKLLKTRYASDPQTRSMLEVVFDSVSYDPCGNYFGFSDGFCGLLYLPYNVLVYGEQRYSSLMRAERSFSKSTLNNFYTALEENQALNESASTEE